MNQLEAISPIDGRYRKQSHTLAGYFSESALMRYRIMVEGEYLIALSQLRGVGVRRFSSREKLIIRKLYKLPAADAEIISSIEFKGYKDIKLTQHDVKAVEYYIKDKLKNTFLKNALEWVHFALTSEDVNNLAYALMLSDATAAEILPALEKIYTALGRLARQHKNLPMLARTHGQPASPTTFGKEFKVFAERLGRQIQQIKNHKLLAKLNGASGNYNAHMAAFPKINWVDFTKRFINSFNKSRILSLAPNLVTTQIEPHDSYIELFDMLRRANSILIGFNQDIWRYISDGLVAQKAVAGEVGSSTMPHKINPIKFENSEGNLGLANSLFEFFARKLPISRLQRDLSDSTVQRNFGTAMSHCLIAYKYLLDGLSRITVDKNKVKQELEEHPEVIAEAIQTILRRQGAAMPYEQLKKLTRGEKVSQEDFKKFINSLVVPEKVKKELKAISVLKYIGLAGKLSEL